MTMKLQTRIRLGYALLAALVMLVGASAIFFIRQQTDAADRILRDNYRSILAAEQMIDALNRIDNAQAVSVLQGNAQAASAVRQRATKDSASKESDVLGEADKDSLRVRSDEAFLSGQSAFLDNLIKAENNVTEPGEKELMQSLRAAFEKYILLCGQLRQPEPASRVSETHRYLTRLVPQYEAVRARCAELLDLNQRAMTAHNEQARSVSQTASLYTLIVSAVALSVALGAMLTIPGVVITPLIALTEKIRRIADRKYTERLEVSSNDELGVLASSFNRMAERLEGFEQASVSALMKEKKQSEAIVKSMSDGIFVLGADGKIVLVNAVGAELFGVSEKDVVGKDVAEVAKYNHLIANLAARVTAPNGKLGSRQPQPYLRIFFRGKEEFFIKEVQEVRDGEPESVVLAYIIALKNVTGFKELDEAKSGFVATVSHELRTPLSAINMSLRLLQDSRIGQLNEEQVRLVEAVKQEVKRLLRIVNELLELSRAESGGDVMRFQAAKPESILDAAITPMLLQAEQKKISLDIVHRPDLPTVKADVSKIAWVLINLIGNAIRYTPEGGRITLEAAADEQPEFVRFSVEDTGAGIEAQYLDKIFEKFFQAPNGTLAAPHSGVGLGLAVSKEIILRHGGKIRVESEVGKGTKFDFILPRA